MNTVPGLKRSNPQELDRLRDKGIKLINETPYRNALGELVAFVHPKSTHGILIELQQSTGHG